jgi:hypothetical protein
MPTSIGNNNIWCGTTGFCNFNTGGTQTSNSAPVAIYGSGSFTRTIGAYGYVNSTAVGNTASANWTHSMAIYCDAGGILVSSGEIDVFCDIRKKQDIVELTDEIVERFININPISFSYKNDENHTKKLGYRAQDLMKNMVGEPLNFTKIHDEKDYLEEMDVACNDGTIVHLEKDEALIVNLQSIIPILHKALQISNKQIKDNQNEIALLKFKLAQSTIVEASTTTPINYDTNILNIVTEANFKQQSINSNLDQRIALEEQKSTMKDSIMISIKNELENINNNLTQIYWPKIADLEHKLNILKGPTNMW